MTETNNLIRYNEFKEQYANMLEHNDISEKIITSHYLHPSKGSSDNIVKHTKEAIIKRKESLIKEAVSLYDLGFESKLLNMVLSWSD